MLVQAGEASGRLRRAWRKLAIAAMEDGLTDRRSSSRVETGTLKSSELMYLGRYLDLEDWIWDKQNAFENVRDV